MRAQVRGLEGHSSNPAAGVNAVEYAAELITFISRLNEEKQLHGPFDAQYEVPHTTLHVGTVHGGTVLNVIPAECIFDFEIRYLPEDSVQPILDRIQKFATDELEPAMKKVSAACGIAFHERFAYPGLSIAPESEVVALVQSLLDSQAPLGKIAFGTEGGLYQQQCGIPVVVCGPGDIANAHQVDEYVDAHQLAACDLLLNRLATALA